MARVGYSCALWEIPPRFKRALLSEFCKLTQIHSTKMYRQTILDIAASHGAITVKIFGSVGRDEARPESDLDLLVTFETAYSLLHMIALKQDLEDLLGCPVDVVTEAALSPYIREQILAEAIRL